MQKTYVLDANVLLQAPYALESFEDNHIVLPLAVLEELDARKGADGEAGNNARQVKGIVTRVGKGTEVVLLGDPAQIDHPPAGCAQQRPDLRQRPHEGQLPVRPTDHPPRRVRALRLGAGCGGADVNERRTFAARQKENLFTFYGALEEEFTSRWYTVPV